MNLAYRMTMSALIEPDFEAADASACHLGVDGTPAEAVATLEALQERMTAQFVKEKVVAKQRREHFATQNYQTNDGRIFFKQ